MAKKKILNVPINFSGKVRIPKDAMKAVESSIKKGELALDLDLVSVKDPDVSLGVSVYPDRVKGTLQFKKDGEFATIDASGVYEMEIGKFEEECLNLPIVVKVLSISDENAESYWLGDDELGVLTDSKVDSYS
jgi:hypothetical protein